MDYHRHVEEERQLRELREAQKQELIQRSGPTVKPRVSTSCLPLKL